MTVKGWQGKTVAKVGVMYQIYCSDNTIFSEAYKSILFNRIEKQVLRYGIQTLFFCFYCLALQCCNVDKSFISLLILILATVHITSNNIRKNLEFKKVQTFQLQTSDISTGVTAVAFSSLKIFIKISTIKC